MEYDAPEGMANQGVEVEYDQGCSQESLLHESSEIELEDNLPKNENEQ